MALRNFRPMRSLRSFLNWLIGGHWSSAGGDLRQNRRTVAVWLNETDSLEDPPRAKPKNFRPRLNKANNNRFELSSFCLQGLVFEYRKWRLLQKHSTKRPVIGRSELDVSVLEELNLTVDPDWTPLRHVNIYGWPTIETEKTGIAQVLHAKQRFIARW